MKLLFLIENPREIGGGDYSIFKFAEFLARNGNEVIIFAQNKNTFYENYDLPRSIKIYYRGSLKRYFRGCEFLNRRYRSVYDYFLLNNFIKENPDIDYVCGYLRDSAIKAVRIGKKFNIKTVNFVFENPLWMEKDLKEKWHKEFQGGFKKSWLTTKQAYIESDILLSNSLISKKECESWINKEVQDFIYPGLDLQMADDVKIDKKENQIIYIGRLDSYKNIDDIIKSLSKIKNPPLLAIVGDGPEKENLVKSSNKLMVKTKFWGNIDDFQKFQQIKKSLFMVFPSSHEGFGMPPMEALYCEIPCICSDKPIFKEVYGGKVEYFKEHDLIDLSKKINFLADNAEYRRKRGKEGRKYIKHKFSWEEAADKIETILLANKRNQ